MMVNFYNIQQNIIDMDYCWNRKTLVLLVPGVSLIIQKIQTSHLLDILRSTYKKSDQFKDLLNSREHVKLETVCGMHTLGSLVQIISLLFLTHFNFLFLAPIAFSIYEMYSSSKGIMREVIQVGDKMYIIG